MDYSQIESICMNSVVKSAELSKENIIGLIKSIKCLKIKKPECYELLYVKCIGFSLNIEEFGELCLICSEAQAKIPSISARIHSKLKEYSYSKSPIGIVSKMSVQSATDNNSYNCQSIIKAWKYYNERYPVVSIEEQNNLIKSII